MSLTVYPAIDLANGACVRLRQGDMAQATRYSGNPAEQAVEWERAGFRWLHLVDLDGAVAGRSLNRAAVAAILRAVTIPVQLGGGIRKVESVVNWLEAGISRIILGSAAVKAPDLLRNVGHRFPNRIVVSIDARDGLVATDGWAVQGTMTALDLAKRAQDYSAAGIVYTDIGRDGMLTGLDLERTSELAAAVGIPVIASGGVSGADDVAALGAIARRTHGHIEGVVVGRALYDGRVTPAAVLAAAARS